jgi:hypothetical protein
VSLAEEAHGAPDADAFPDRREKWSSPYRGTPFGVSFHWLVTGALAYALLLLVTISGRPDDAVLLPFLGPSFYLTPVFGLPYVLATVGRPGRTRRLIYFLLLLPLAHMAAIYVAWDHGLSRYAFEPGHETVHLLKSGAFGGVTGAVLALTLLWLTGLTARPRAELFWMGVATIALTAIGAAGLAQAARSTGGISSAATHDSGLLIIGFEAIHFPWQIAFAVALAWLMRPVKS